MPLLDGGDDGGLCYSLRRWTLYSEQCVRLVDLSSFKLDLSGGQSSIGSILCRQLNR